jgi:uncharacterized protein YgbK (DUF1537 family)
MLLGVIADDFTGASDIANTLTKGYGGQGRLVTSQFIGIPTEPAPQDVAAGVISLKTRSIPAPEAVSQSLAALQWLRQQGCTQFVFKYSSTFDSTPQGNIGTVAEALADTLGVKGVVVCPAFPDAGRTVYRGHLFVHDKLLNESGMEQHPLTPMTDADIRRWLRRQTTGEGGHVTADSVRRGKESIVRDLRSSAHAGETLTVVDATSNEDLVTIGKACGEAVFLTGGSGIALGLPSNFIERGLASSTGQPFAGKQGPEAILAGSCSGATRGQIDAHARNHPVLPISVEAVMAGKLGSDDLVAFMMSNRGKKPLAYSSGTPDQVLAAQRRYGREEVSERLDDLFAATARRLVDEGVDRLVVAGGETSGAVAQALDLGDLAIGAEIAAGVPVLVSRRRNIALALKSGNFGGPRFFEEAIDALSGQHPQ